MAGKRKTSSGGQGKAKALKASPEPEPLENGGPVKLFTEWLIFGGIFFS